MFQRHSHVQGPGHKHTPTAHLTHTMTLLGLSAAELQQHIESELSNNPALELVVEKRCPTCSRLLRVPGPCPKCSMSAGNGVEDPVIFVSTREDYSFFGEAGHGGHALSRIPPPPSMTWHPTSCARLERNSARRTASLQRLF